MYMYYLLGHRLMELPISVDRKEVLAENTYILTLDGDIDFQPPAVSLLVDLMKKNRNLGAACGRIHPVGSGPMVWYQVNNISGRHNSAFVDWNFFYSYLNMQLDIGFKRPLNI